MWVLHLIAIITCTNGQLIIVIGQGLPVNLMLGFHLINSYFVLDAETANLGNFVIYTFKSILTMMFGEGGISPWIVRNQIYPFKTIYDVPK